MSNVHVIHVEDANGDLVDILRYCHSCAPSEASEWPAPESIDYPVYCEVCGDRLPVPLTAEGEAAMAENDTPVLCDCGHDGYEGHDMRPSPPACLTTDCPCGVEEANEDGAIARVVGRWTVRIAPAPALLWHGMDRGWTRERHPYEQGTVVEVYDRRFMVEQGFSPLGQFVSAYGTRDLAGLKCGLNLNGGVASWKMDADEVTTMLALIAREGSRMLTLDEAEAAGLDGTGRDLDPRFPYRLSDLTVEERTRWAIHDVDEALTDMGATAATYGDLHDLFDANDLPAYEGLYDPSNDTVAAIQNAVDEWLRARS